MRGLLSLITSFERGAYGACPGSYEGKHCFDVWFAPYKYDKNVLMNTSGAFNNAYLLRAYPPGTFVVTGTDVGFTDFVTRDFRLASSSPFKNAGTDGKDIGADAEAVYALTAVGAGLVARVGAGPQVTDTATTPPTKPDTSPSSRRVSLLYQGFVGREPDGDELSFWSAQDPALLALALYASDEFRASSYKTVQLYRALLAREPRYLDEYVPLVDGIRKGTLTPADVAARLLVETALSTPKQLATAICSNLHASAREQTCETYVHDIVAADGVTGAAVVRALESVHAIPVWQNRYAVYLMYATALNRQPDDGGFNYLVAILNQNGSDIDWLVNAFISCPEFRNRLN